MTPHTRMAASDRLDHLLLAGDRIGNYRIELELASHATTASYRAVHVMLPRHAVIKIHHAPTDQASVLSMLREACILDALHHPGIIRVYESGLHEGRPWFATELVDASTIDNLLSPDAIDHVAAIALMRDLAQVIEHAYRRGVIHCGLRPERILMTGRTRGFPICVADWSDARAHDARSQQLAPSVAAWHYTSPELRCGDPIDDRTDVFALGVLAYQMLAGRMPFDNGILATVDDGTTQHVPIGVHCRDLPPELTRLVDQMLAYDRWDRPRAVDVVSELSWLADVFTTPIHTRPPASGMPRIRRPRWTPALSFGGPSETPPPEHDAIPVSDDAE
ncbi:MAG: pknB [Deltaproteobacteria bacterium]|nr:pknB [Deltaproteobacteria bacterium]